jgi:hypothetical protein
MILWKHLRASVLAMPLGHHLNQVLQVALEATGPLSAEELSVPQQLAMWHRMLRARRRMAAEGLQGDAVLDSLQPFVMLHDLEEVHQYLLGRAQFNLELCGFERERLPFYGPVGEPVIRC